LRGVVTPKQSRRKQYFSGLLRRSAPRNDIIKQRMQIFEILNFLNFFLPLFWLAGILVYWAKYQEIKIWWIKYGVIVMLALYIVWGLYTSYANYNLWKIDPISRYLLPPHNASYIYEYSFFHYWLPNIINVAVSLVWAMALLGLYKYSKGRLLDKEDIWLGFFTALIVGWPKFIIYLVLVFGVLLVRQVIGNFILKNKNPIIISQSLIFSALILAIFGKFFINYLGLDVLAF